MSNKGNEFIDLQTAIDEQEEEYEVNVSGCFTVMATSQESANGWIENELQGGNTTYTCALEVGE